MKKLLICIVVLIGLIRCSDTFEGELIFVEPDHEDAFHYPYFLYVPKNVSQTAIVSIVVEPNNSGFADDDFQKHIEKARRIATKDFYPGNYVAQNLNIPLLVPVFPRPKTEWQIYAHALDRDVMSQKDDSLERIDEQLIQMIDDARRKLVNMNIDAGEKFLMTGFSASGTFANRFALIHPDKVLAVGAGGVNGLLMLPLDSLNSTELKYPLGTGDLKTFLNTEFKKEMFLRTPQFYFMGELDDNDAVPYDDAFSQEERDNIYRLLGKEMLPGRWNNCKNIYRNNNVNATIKTFANVGHEQPEMIKKEIVAFFKEILGVN